MSRVVVLALALQGCGLAGEPGGEAELAASAPVSERDVGWAADTREEPRASRALAPDLASFEESGRAGRASAAATSRGPSIESACTGDRLGSFDYCSTSCPCGAGQGDCDSDAQCTAGNVCMRDTGALFGLNPELDMCMEECSPDALGTPDFCSASCQCEAGQGDCDDDDDCAGGSVCAQNVGASFGFTADVDVCVDACDEVFNGTFDYCSPGCPCEHGQGDCDSDADCATGHVCARDAGAAYGFDPEMDVCESVSPETQAFAGRVIDERGDAVVGAQVSIDGTSVETGGDGDFALATAASERHVINVEKSGYVPISRVHLGAGVTDMVVILGRAERIAIDPAQPVDIEDSSGTRITLAANALVDENGLPPAGPVTVEIHTYDLLKEEMVGNMEAVDESGNIVALQSVGAVSTEFVGADGTRYQLAPGQTADISVELPPEIEFSGPIPLWHYDEAQGRWIEEGMGVVENGVAYGTVSHFSVWNFDMKFQAPACMRVEVPNLLMPSEDTIRARVVVGGTSVREIDLARGTNVFYNLPQSTPVSIFVPANATEPLETVTTGGPGAPSPPDHLACTALVTLPNQLPGSVSGFGLLDGAAADAAEMGTATHAGLTVEVRARGAVVATGTADAFGTYRVEVPSGTYDVDLVHAGYLRMRATGVTVGSGKTQYMPCVQLRGGDVNGDDRIDETDRDLVQAAQGSSAAPGDPLDVNGDGIIDALDLGVVQSNLGTTGPLAPGPDSQCAASENSEIVAGVIHTCALQDSGALRCWGYNDYGQLGYGHTRHLGDDETLVAVPNVAVGGPVRDVAPGYLHTCALMRAGTVRCWGHGGFGQLGYGNTNTIGDNENPATAGDVPVGGQVVQVAAGWYHTCALLDTGAVRCWGYNGNGQLGYGNTNPIGDNEAPASAGDVNVGGLVVHISAGRDHTCALLNTGAVRCWGYNGFGQLGYGNTNQIGDNETPASAGDVAVGGPVGQLVTGGYHTCARLNTGGVRCWGANFYGQLGYGNTNDIGDNETPASAGDVSLGGIAGPITTGYGHVCARLDTGGARCWGRNYFGELGYGHTNHIGDNELPASVPVVPFL